MRIGPTLVLLTVIALTGGCVKIQTGQTPDEARESSEERAHRLKVDWAETLSKANLSQKISLWAGIYESYSRGLIDYGWSVAREWRNAEAGRGKTVESSEMRGQIEQWTATEQPFIKAWEENLEYGRQVIHEWESTDQNLMTALDQALDHYYHVYSKVMFPSSTLADYESDLARLQSEVDDRVQELRRLAERY